MRRLVLVSLFALAACGKPTGTVCPTDSKLTYGEFGKPFMDKYCVSCHATKKTGDDRNGAPEGYDFDQLPNIVKYKDDIDSLAGAGPEATNTWMPSGDEAKPSEAERKQLAEWLACGAK